MTREMFVSSTPHETKVGLVEDDQLAEVYLERENEYTLAGSIYKGRVTRVLPGMQSAFVDIGLERDAFLYVSDFMELENQEEDLDEIPTTPVLVESSPERPEAPAHHNGESSEAAEVETAKSESMGGSSEARSSEPRSSEPKEDRGGWRGRRRRGRRDRGHGAPEPRYSRPAETQPAPEREPREQYGPPAGYEPIILPGESISKYRNRPQAASVPEPASAAESRRPQLSQLPSQKMSRFLPSPATKPRKPKDCRFRLNSWSTKEILEQVCPRPLTLRNGIASSSGSIR
jgi:ribonuclease G